MEHSAVSYVSDLQVLTLPSTLENIGRAPIESAESLEKIIVNGKSKAVCDKYGSSRDSRCLGLRALRQREFFLSTAL